MSSPPATLAAAVIFAVSIAAGYQNHKFQGAGQDVFDLGPAPSRFAVPKADIAQPRVGLRYEHIGLMGIDVWRYNGQFAVYEDHSSYLSYVDLTDDDVGDLGLSTPWRYYFPEGLIALLCLAELFIVALKPRTIRFALVTGGVLVVIALVFRLKGLTWECVFPALLAMSHLYTGFGALWSDRRERAGSTEPEVPRTPEPKRVRVDVRAAPPTFEKDPFRSPPQAPPLAIHRAETAPAEPPVDFHDDAEPPKLLR
jgi:hypothetical protein